MGDLNRVFQWGGEEKKKEEVWETKIKYDRLKKKRGKELS